MPVRGFESTMDYRPQVGLGTLEVVDSVIVQWPDQRVTKLIQVQTGQTLHLHQSEAEVLPVAGESREEPRLFRDVTHELSFAYEHQENDFVDFDRDRLIYHMLSSAGPRVAVGDVNGDGREDLYIGGAKDQAGSLMLQTGAGAFQESNYSVFEKDKLAEDTEVLFFDADADADLDLYVAQWRQ